MVVRTNSQSTKNGTSVLNTIFFPSLPILDTPQLFSDYHKSPNCGRYILENNKNPGNQRSLLKTGDIGQMDSSRRLRILGRTKDNAIRGYWPADMLDVVGEVIGHRCALIQHPTPESIVIRVWGECEEELRNKVRDSVVHLLGLPYRAIRVDGVQSPLHSYKIPRVNK